MKKHKLKLLASSIGASIFMGMLPNQAFASFSAACTPSGLAPALFAVNVFGGPANPNQSICTSEKHAYKFTDLAASNISQFGLEIQTAGQAISQAIAAHASSEVDMLYTNNTELQKLLMTITNSTVKDQLMQDKMLLDMEMNYKTELEERKVKASQSVFSMDDSAEEAIFIINELKTIGPGTEGNYNHSQEVIAAMKAKYDDNASFKMPIRLKSASANNVKGEGCAVYDPVAHKNGTLDKTCFYEVPSNPGAKLQKYFTECSRLKADSVASVKKNRASSVSSSAQTKSQSSYMKKASLGSSSSSLSQTKIAHQKETSCNINEFDYKLCGTDESGAQMTKPDYFKKVIDLEIIPNGNVSASNFLAPVSVGSIDGDTGDMTDEERIAMSTSALDYKKVDGTDDPAVAVSTNTPKIDKTYRTSAQYFAAIDFVDNVINKEAVSGMNVTRNTNAESAQFQAKFLSRAASLSLAENSLREPIALRIGSSVSEKIEEATAAGENFDRTSEFVKEDINGAGALDVLTHLVDKDYNKLQTDAKSAINNGGVQGLNTGPSQAGNWQVDALIKANHISLLQFEQNERIELLIAALLANTTNSETNIRFINSLKLK